MGTYTDTATVTITAENGDEQEFEVTCEFDFSPAESGSRERGTGLQMEPDYPATMDLVSAKTSDGTDLLDKLDDDQVQALEIEALEFGGDRDDCDPPDDDYDDYIGPD
jgi:hypothetical protein